MIARRFLIPVGLFGVLAFPIATRAQAPGYRGPSAGQLRAEYRAEVLVQVNRAMTEWGTAWDGDDVDALATLYLEDAVVFPAGGDPIRGREAIRAWLRETLPAHGSVEEFLQDFEVSGGMAMAYSRYRIQLPGEGRVGEVSGELITIHLQRGRSWKIRSQVFRQR